MNPRIQSSRPHSQAGVVARPKMQVIGSSTTSVAQGVTTGLTGPPKSRAPKPQVAAPSSHTIGMQGQVLVVAPVAVATRPNPAQTASAHGKSTSAHAVVGQTQQTSGVMTRPVMPVTQQRPASFHEVPIVIGAKPQQAPRPGSAQATTRPVNQSEIKTSSWPSCSASTNRQRSWSTTRPWYYYRSWERWPTSWRKGRSSS